MDNPIRLLYSVFIFTIFSTSFLIVPAFVSADHATTHTIQQLQEQVEQLQTRIRALQQQLSNVSQTKPEPAPRVSSVCPVFSHTLYRGVRDESTGGEVTKLQKMLAEDPTVYPEGFVTGYYGSLTEKAVQRWQAKQGTISSGDPTTTGYGVVGPQTRARIVVACSTPALIPIPPIPPGSPPLVTVLSPNGGEKWVLGSDQTIQWSSPGFTVGSAVGTIAFMDIDLLSWGPGCIANPCPPSSPSFSAALARKVPNTGSFSWSWTKIFAGNTIPTGSYVVRISNSANSGQYDQSDDAFSIVVSGDTTGTITGAIIRKVGEQESSFLIQKINPDNVEGLWYEAYPMPSMIGTPKTLRIGDDIGYACNGVSEKLIHIDFSVQKVTFYKIVSQPSLVGCPICLAGNTMINTPSGLVSVKNLQVGMPIWTTDKSGHRVSGIVTKTSKVPVPPTHQMVHLVLDDGRELLVSPGHPTIDGRTAGNLTANNLYDGAHVIAFDRIIYGDMATYDILPSGETGFYWANGILFGSTLH